MPEQKHFSAEQIDFLNKFFKDNPWAETAQLESIVKETGLTESIIKVKQTNREWSDQRVHLSIFLLGLSRSTTSEMELDVSTG